MKGMTGRVVQVDLRLTAEAFQMYVPLFCIVSTLAELGMDGTV
jgi:hypothetical protein